MNMDWKCPYCGQYARVTDREFRETDFFFGLREYGLLWALRTKAITCPNPLCYKPTISASLHEAEEENAPYSLGEQVSSYQLEPASLAKPFPDYIPAAILQDYKEACSILIRSPRASATLARRCLQGMIRDFFEATGKNLYQEIQSVEGRIEPRIKEAIDAVRKIGNIGAHMEKDVNAIIDIDPGEAEVLLELIEMLLEQWYIKRHEQEESLKKVVALAEEKITAKKTN
jgi:hypothetical protein